MTPPPDRLAEIEAEIESERTHRCGSHKHASELLAIARRERERAERAEAACKDEETLKWRFRDARDVAIKERDAARAAFHQERRDGDKARRRSLDLEAEVRDLAKAYHAADAECEKAESDLARLERLIGDHHDAGTVHKRCGKHAVADNWGKVCPVCEEAALAGADGRPAIKDGGKGTTEPMASRGECSNPAKPARPACNHDWVPRSDDGIVWACTQCGDRRKDEPAPPKPEPCTGFTTTIEGFGSHPLVVRTNCHCPACPARGA